MNEEKRNIWDYWSMPGYSPRDSQVTAINWLANLPADKKYIFCQLPVGVGKSAIALTLAGYLGHGNMGSSYILTPQRILQRQYEESFQDQELISVYGKANYFCNSKAKRGMNCDDGDDIKPKCEDCPAKAAFGAIKNRPHAVLNYKLALLYAELYPLGSRDFPVKDLMVFDECHTLENHLVSHRAVSIGQQRCDKAGVKFFKPVDLKQAHDWVWEKYFPELDKLYAKLAREVEYINNKYEFEVNAKLSKDELKTMRTHKDVKRHREKIKKIALMDYEKLERNYVMVHDKKNFEFKEIYGSNLFEKILEPKADRFLFMSSTILNFEEYAKDLGIPTDEIATLDLGSEFDVENRRVYYMPTSKMNYGWEKPDRADTRKKMLDRVVELCNVHEGECGIVHTGSFKIAQWLITELESKIGQRIITHNGEDNASRDDCIETFTENEGKEPMLLVSPSCTEGLDLKYDRARFAIFVKVPYPFLGDQWVKRRQELSSEWYQRQAMVSIIQGGGRVVRSDDDWGNTYILDESFNYLWYQFKGLTPSWWKEAFVRMKK